MVLYLLMVDTVVRISIWMLLAENIKCCWFLTSINVPTCPNPKPAPAMPYMPTSRLANSYTIDGRTSRIFWDDSGSPILKTKRELRQYTPHSGATVGSRLCKCDIRKRWELLACHARVLLRCGIFGVK